MTLSGPTLAAARGPATHLLVLVHGYGADGQDLIGLASHWQGLLPTVAFAAPNAPMRIPGGPGYQWFPISRIHPHEMQKGVEVAGPALDEYLDAELTIPDQRRHNLSRQTLRVRNLRTEQLHVDMIHQHKKDSETAKKVDAIKPGPALRRSRELR